MLKIKCHKLLFFFIPLIFIACSSSMQVTSQQNNNEIKIDGNHSDWKQMNNIKGENISFGFSNDQNNLYISMITNDRNKIMKILRGGLFVWIDPGNSEDKIGIKYPEQPDPAEMQERFKDKGMQQGPPDRQNPQQDMKEQRDIDPMMNTFLKEQKELYVLDEDGKMLSSYPVDGDLYQASIKIDKNNLCYEVKVPFGKKPLLNYNINNNPKENISVEFISGDIETDDNAPGPGMGGGMRPPEGGNPPMGQGGPGGPGGGQGGPGNGPGRNQGSKVDLSPLDYSFDVLLK